MKAPRTCSSKPSRRWSWIARTALAGGILACAAVSIAAAPFRLHLPSEPSSLNPQNQRTSASSYLLYNLHRNLFKVDSHSRLQPDLGESCVREKNRLKCRLKKSLKWSDGTNLTSQDFLRAYQRLLDPKSKAPRADLLFSIKNAQKIYRKEKTPASLGITAPDSRTLIFEFETKDPEFEWSLASYLLAPYPSAPKNNDLWSGPFSGPYRLGSHEKGRKLSITPNPHFPGAASHRPDVEFYFINEDTTSLNLYLKDGLDFLRRLPTAHIPRYQKSSEFHWQPVTRLDYLGFGPRLKDHPSLRKALIYSLNYLELKRIFSAEGAPPGCAGLPADWFPKGHVPCYTQNLAEAKKLKPPESRRHLRMGFSNLGGDEHRRGAEWQQDQWRAHLGLTVSISPIESKVFNDRLRTDPPDIFRKGLAADRPTCLSVVRTFTTDHHENFIRFASKEFDALVDKLADARTDKERKELCGRVVQTLLDEHVLIPLGAMHFAILAKKTFKGWELNPLNQLDLSNLSTVTDRP